MYFQVAIKIIDKTQLNPGSLQKVRLLTAVYIQFVWQSSLLCIIIIGYIGMILSFSVLSRCVFTLYDPVSHSLEWSGPCLASSVTSLSCGEGEENLLPTECKCVILSYLRQALIISLYVINYLIFVKISLCIVWARNWRFINIIHIKMILRQNSFYPTTDDHKFLIV